MASAVTLFALGSAAAQINPNPVCLTGGEGRPSVFGISGGNNSSISGSSCCTGTLGAMVQDKKGRDYVLSTNTVLARVSTDDKGARRAQVGEKIDQPGLVDTGCFRGPTNKVGTLSRWVPLQFGINNNNSVDAAIALLKPGMFYSDGYIFNIGPISASTLAPDELVVGGFVQKMGRTTCLTEGQIDAVDATGKVAYANDDCHQLGSGNALFSNQILIINSSRPNASGTFATTDDGGSDSGSVVLTEETCPRAIGLVFGATSNGITVINPINEVLSKLKVQMVGGCTNDGPSPFFASAADQPDEQSDTDPQTAMRASIEAVRAVKDRHEHELLKLDEVTATAIGRDDNSDGAAMLVFVKKDTPQVRAKIPTELEGVPVKVVESGEFKAL
jgi:hypothetical protein